MKTIIIDDEEANREILRNFICKYCPSLTLEGEAESAEKGYELIKRKNPDLLFLDVRMPGKNGFDLLKMFQAIDFQVIFVTGHGEYAISAFEFSAVDYILKPVDHQKLVLSVEKATKNHRLAKQIDYLSFIQLADARNDLTDRLSLHHNGKVVLVNLGDISHIEAVGNYCEIVTADNQHFLSSKTLLIYEQMLSAGGKFVRISKKMLINILHVTGYSKGAGCFLNLVNNREVEVSRRKKGEVLQLLKKFQTPDC